MKYEEIRSNGDGYKIAANGGLNDNWSEVLYLIIFILKIRVILILKIKKKGSVATDLLRNALLG